MTESQRHDMTYEAVCKLLDDIATPLRQYMDSFTQDELTRPLKYALTFVDEYPYAQFQHEHDGMPFTFPSASQWWERFYGHAEANRFTTLMCYELREMVAARGEYAAHVAAVEAQQELMAEGVTAA